MTARSKDAYHTARSDERFGVSFEFFPPRTTRGLYRLLDHAIGIQAFEPSFLSVTYGALGSSQANTLRTAESLRNLETMPIAGHLTCVGAARAETDEMIRYYRDGGVEHIVALRGDAGPEQEPYRPHPDGYRNAADLTAAIRRQGNFRISVAAYPESHPDSADEAADIANLKQKFDAGADDAITQFFLDNTYFYRFLDRLEKAGIDKPVTPGILLINDFWKVKAFAARCGATIPDWISARYDGLENDPETHKLVSVGLAVEQALELASQGVRDFHFYTFNRSDMALAVCRTLGLTVNPALEQAA